MPFTVVAPYVGFPLKVDAEDFSEAAKKAIKLNQEVQIMSMIINDHTNNMRMLANIDYYNQEGRRKAGVKMSKTKALGYQGYPTLSPTIIMGVSTEDKPSDISPYLIAMGANGLPILPFGGPMAVSGLGGPAIIAGPAGTGLAAVPSGRMGPYGSPFGLPHGAVPVVNGLPFGFGFGENLDEQIKRITSEIAGKEAGLASAQSAFPPLTDKVTKYTEELTKLKTKLAELNVKKAERDAKKSS